MTFNDIFKSDFLDNVSSFSVSDTLLAMAFSVILALFIFLIYKKTFSGVMFSTSFSLTLIGLATVTTLVILAISSNVVLSLGMVGALSIVRFRTAIKEPVEIVFLFWAIAVGIVTGAGMIPLAVIGSVIIGVLLLLCAKRKVRYQPYILVLNCRDEAAESQAAQIIGDNVQYQAVKSKTVNDTGIELTREIRLKNDETDFINRLNQIDGISNATLVSYNGEYMS